MCDNCDDFSAHPELHVDSSSVAHTYRLCFRCAYNLNKNKKPTIYQVQISTNTVKSFRELTRNIVLRSYEISSDHMCCDCNKIENKRINNSDDNICSTLGIDNGLNYVCSVCIKKYL